MTDGRLFSDSARIDIATNFASFDSIDFSADFEDFLHGDLGAAHLLSLIHEATHHWCLITPVGTALAARTFRTYHDAALIAAAGSGREAYNHDRKKQLDSSIFVSRTLTAFFVPLLEGLALYAEWRACPAEGGTFSRPFDLLRRVAGRSEPSETERALLERMFREAEGLSAEALQPVIKAWLDDDDVRQFEREGIWGFTLALSRLRRRPADRKRLGRIFRTAMDPRYGSYQLGYLFVCALEAICGANGRSDLLLAFLRDHFFNDLELAALILDESFELADLYGEVRSRLQSKAFDLICDPAAATDRLIKWGEQQPFTPLARDGVDDFFGHHPPLGRFTATQNLCSEAAGFLPIGRLACHSAGGARTLPGRRPDVDAARVQGVPAALGRRGPADLRRRGRRRDIVADRRTRHRPQSR